MQNTFSIKNSAALSLNSMRIGLPPQTSSAPKPHALKPQHVAATAPAVAAPSTTPVSHPPVSHAQATPQPLQHASPHLSLPPSLLPSTGSHHQATKSDTGDKDNTSVVEFAGMVSFWGMFLLGLVSPFHVDETTRMLGIDKHGEGRKPISSFLACMMAPALCGYIGSRGSSTRWKRLACTIALCSCCGSMWIREDDAIHDHYTFILERGLALVGLLASSAYVGVSCMLMRMSDTTHTHSGMVYASTLMQVGLVLLGVAIPDSMGVLFVWGLVASTTLLGFASGPFASAKKIPGRKMGSFV